MMSCASYNNFFRNHKYGREEKEAVGYWIACCGDVDHMNVTISGSGKCGIYNNMMMDEEGEQNRSAEIIQHVGDLKVFVLLNDGRNWMVWCR